jgi:uncharacterized membrane protein HdeD (DUF308 family)
MSMIEAKQALHRHWAAFMIEGVALVILGALAILVPPLATLAVALFLGWLFLVSGVIGLVTSFWMKSAPGFWWSLLSAVLGIVVGALLIGWPAGGAVSLTLVLIAFFAIEGVISIFYAFEHKRALSGRWFWLALNGIVDLVLAGVIFAGLPGTAVWALGLLVGIDLVFGGLALVAMSLHARKA